MPDVEYAKYVKLPVTSSAKGFKTDLLLPSSKTTPSGANFINFYVGLGGYECGISTRGSESGWHWFVNSNYGDDESGTEGEFSNSESVNISLQILQYSGTIYRMKFYVNGVHKFSGTENLTSSTSYTDGRIIIASLENVYSYIPDPLPDFNVRHNQVKTYNTKYKNTAGNWVNVNSGNCTPDIFHNPTGVTTPSPVDYTGNAASFGSASGGIYYASIK